MRIAIAGISGRMGQILVQTILKSNFPLEFSVALDQSESPLIGKDAGYYFGRNTGIITTDDLNSLAMADCLIDFTHPDGTLKHLDACVRHNTNIVIGTTGFSKNDRNIINATSKKIAIVFAPNMSIGVNAFFKLIDIASKMLGSEYDVEISESHHRNKIDAPSGTALEIGRIIASARNLSLADVATWERYGNIGKRKPETIGFSIIRGGDSIGKHTVYFFGTGEQIEITHYSNNRSTYAEGSIRAAFFLNDKTNGIYDMQAVLNL